MYHRLTCTIGCHWYHRQSENTERVKYEHGKIQNIKCEFHDLLSAIILAQKTVMISKLCCNLLQFCCSLLFVFITGCHLETFDEMSSFGTLLYCQRSRFSVQLAVNGQNVTIGLNAICIPPTGRRLKGYETYDPVLHFDETYDPVLHFDETYDPVLHFDWANLRTCNTVERVYITHSLMPLCLCPIAIMVHVPRCDCVHRSFTLFRDRWTPLPIKVR